MGFGKVAAVAGVLAAASSAGHAQDLVQDSVPTTMFYVSVPLGGGTARERLPSYGLAMKGRKQYEAVLVDSRMFNFTGLGGFEAKWLIAGGLAVGAGYFILKKDGGGSGGSGSGGSGSQEQTCAPVDPCKK